MKFRKKPVVIEAVQFIGAQRGAAWSWAVANSPPDRKVSAVTDDKGHHMIIQTLEGDMRVDEGDWVIKGVRGELYPCKPEIFKETYEAVE